MTAAIVFYTANRIAERFSLAVQAEIVRNSGGKYPIVCVSRKPMDFGDVRIVVGDAECGPPSIYGVYRQVLIGAQATDADYVIMAEDDSLAVPEYYEWRPPDDRVFWFNRNRWVLTRRLSDDGKSRVGLFYWRERCQMAQLVCRRSLLVETLRERFEKFPDPVPDDVAYRTGHGEPGRYEKNLGLPRRERAYFDTALPNVTVNHSESIRGRRRVNPDDIIKTDLEPWGNATELWRRIVG